MQSSVLPAGLDALSEAERRALLTDPAMGTVQGVFAAVPDPRRRRGRRDDLPLLLTCLVAALLSTGNSTAAGGQGCQEHRALLGRRYPHARFLTPTGALYRWLVPRLSVAELEWALAGWVRATRAVWEREAVALDGKTVRGAAVRQPDGTSSAPHLRSISGHERRATLLQVRVDGKTNEIPVAQALLPYIPRRGRVVTADALHTQTAFAQGVLDQGGDYLRCRQPAYPLRRPRAGRRRPCDRLHSARQHHRPPTRPDRSP
jgi:DDE_Tnp_1-associated